MNVPEMLTRIEEIVEQLIKIADDYPECGDGLEYLGNYKDEAIDLLGRIRASWKEDNQARSDGICHHGQSTY